MNNNTSTLQDLYEYYKGILPGRIKMISGNTLIWQIDKTTSLFVISDEYRINLVADRKILVKLAKSDYEYYKEDEKRFYKDAKIIINKIKKGEEKEPLFARKYCLSLAKKRNKNYLIISVLITIILLVISYSILFK